MSITDWKAVYAKRIAKNDLELWSAIADTAAALTRCSSKVKETAMAAALYDYAEKIVHSHEVTKAAEKRIVRDNVTGAGEDSL